MEYTKDISIVVPLYNEEESLPELHQWIVRVMKANNFSYEVIFIDDGSKDNSWAVVEDLKAKDENIVGIKFRRNYGKSAGLQVGFTEAIGRVVITMDADLQDSPDEIPELNRMIVEDGFDLVSGWKQKRYDPLSKTIPTKIYNGVTRAMSGIKLNDMNCGLKAYKNEVVKSVEVYGEMHRYIPVMAKWAGFNNIGEKVVVHQARKYGVTKFGLERFINGPLDLMSIIFVQKFSKRPMHFFGYMGIVVMMIALLSVVWLGVDKMWIDTSGRLITERPVFFIGLVSMVIGVQLFLVGFLAEMVSQNRPNRNSYQIEEE